MKQFSAGPDGDEWAVRIERGFPESCRDRVAHLFWEAFSGKLGRIMAPAPTALDFIRDALNPDRAFVARSGSGELLGVAGFKTCRGGLIGGSRSDLVRGYGRFGGIWREALLGLSDRRLAPGQLSIDGIFVTACARGRGIGTTLIAEIEREAVNRGAKEIRLEVAQSNRRARALYVRLGFEPAGRIRGLSWVLGHGPAAVMRKDLAAQASVEGSRDAA